MIIEEQQIKGVYIIKEEPFQDERGALGRVVCQNQMKMFNTNFVQSSISYNKKKHTLRGMHYQTAPMEEEKLVKCIQGRILDVIVDLRENSSTKYNWMSIELSANDFTSIYIPKGCAHGFLTLEDNSNVLYYITEFYSPKHAAGINYLDTQIDIQWPDTNKIIISEKDKNLPFIKGDLE